MPVKLDEVEIGKSYQLNNGMVRRIFEIVKDPRVAHAHNEISDADIIKFEAEKWGYDAKTHGGKTRTKIKIREKLKRVDFAKEASKRLD